MLNSSISKQTTSTHTTNISHDYEQTKSVASNKIKVMNKDEIINKLLDDGYDKEQLRALAGRMMERCPEAVKNTYDKLSDALMKTKFIKSKVELYPSSVTGQLGVNDFPEYAFEAISNEVSMHDLRAIAATNGICYNQLECIFKKHLHDSKGTAYEILHMIKNKAGKTVGEFFSDIHEYQSK